MAFVKSSSDWWLGVANAMAGGMMTAASACLIMEGLELGSSERSPSVSSTRPSASAYSRTTRRFAAALEYAHAHGALRALEHLELGVNKIGDEGGKAVGEALKTNTTLTNLELSLIHI
mgnify:CR=1 FL=1